MKNIDDFFGKLANIILLAGIIILCAYCAREYKKDLIKEAIKETR